MPVAPRRRARGIYTRNYRKGSKARMLKRLLVSLTLFCITFSLSNALLIVSQATVEGVVNPLAIDLEWAPQPSFAWSVAGGIQSLFHVRVASDASFSVASLVWDSGIVNSSISAAIYAGEAPLPHGTDLYLQVEAADSFGVWSLPSLSTFGTGLDSVEWARDAVTQSAWLGACTSGAGVPSLRLSFSLSSDPIVRARAYASSLGLYALSVNGARAGGGVDAVLTPGWATVPTYRVNADAYNVTTALFSGGENVLGFRLGQGKYGYNGEFCKAADASCYAGVVRVIIEQEGGNVTTVDSSVTWPWICAPSETTYNSLFGGETIDERLAQPGWDSPGFVPGPNWSPARRPTNLTVAILSAAPPAMRIIANITPSSVSARNTSSIYNVSGGAFLKSDTNPDVWWVLGWPSAPLFRFFVTVCQPCAEVNACGMLIDVSESVIDAIPVASTNFTCAQLPSVNTTVFQFDLGKNMAGFCTLALPPLLKAGDSLSLVHGEILNKEGAVDNTFGSSNGIRNCPVPGINCADQTDTFIAGPSRSILTFTPTFTFHGFRYVALFGWPTAAPPPTINSLICHTVHSAMVVAGNSTFNNTILNQLQAAVLLTQRSNFFSIPSDCPTREKRGWGGDAMVTVDSALLNLAAQTLYEEWMRTFTDLQTMSCIQESLLPSTTNTNPYINHTNIEFVTPLPPPSPPSDYVCCPPNRFGCNSKTPHNATGFLPDVLPFDSISGWPGDFLWQAVAITVPHALLTSQGNVPALSRGWSMIYELIDAADQAVDATTGLLTLGAYGDWLASEPVSMSFAQNFYFLHSASLAAEIAGALGYTVDATALTALAAAISARMVEAHYNQLTGVWDGTDVNQNAQAMALAVGLGGAATSNGTALTEAALAADFIARGAHGTCGVASSRWIFAGLDAAGRSDLALELALQPSQPSFAFMVATADMPGTIWENWNGDATTSDGSKNHPMLTGGLGVWLFEGAAGLKFRYQLDTLPSFNDNTDSNVHANAALSTSALNFDPRIRAGLSNDETLAALALAESDKISDNFRGGFLRRARDQLIAAGIPTRVTPRKLLPTLRIAPRDAIMRTLGSASAWHTTPAGRVGTSWTWTSMPHLEIRVTTASSIHTSLALPLSILTSTHIITVTDNTGAIVFNGEMVVVGSGEEVGSFSSSQYFCAPVTHIIYVSREEKYVKLCGTGIPLPVIASSDDDLLLWKLPNGSEGEWIFDFKGETT